MTRISLVVPFALPPPELAPDLARAMQTPALASLVTRSRSRTDAMHDDTLRTLPYESWLAHHTGVSADGSAAFAASVMRRFGHDPQGGSWFIVNPAHIEVARSHLLLHDLRSLRLSEAHARALFEAALPYFEDSGKTLLYGDAATWFMRADGWSGMSTSTPDAAATLNLTEWLPAGPQAIEFRKLQNEVQMLWFDHAANLERAERGQSAVNAFWPWAPTTAPLAPAAGAPPLALATSGVPGWLGALATESDAAIGTLVASRNDAVLVCGQLIEPAIATDWATWLAHMAQLERTVFAPALDAVKAGRIELQLLLSDRLRQRALTTTSLTQRAFWRRPTLTALFP